jgi:molybdopterin-containing oxidoreductase family iron-sulfur binding subunit
MLHRLGIDATRASCDGLGRRGFMKVLGASLALAGVEGCTRMPASNILPYVDQPELAPGVPQYYATSMVIDGYATGLLVESHEGRPTKIEGHPDHPASLGAAGVLEQASVLQVYDPNRAARIRHGEQTASWQALADALGPATLRSQLGAGGAGLYLLLEPTSSPLEIELLDRLRDQYPAMRICFYAPLAAPDEALIQHYDFAAADVVLVVDDDCLAGGPFHLRYARQFAERRRPESSSGMNRLYAIESSVTATGATADHRLAVRPRDIVPLLERLLAATGGADAPRADGPAAGWVDAVARDLRAHAGRSLVVAGPYLPARARSVARQINERLGNLGRTTWFTRSPIAGAGDPAYGVGALAAALRAGDVDTLVCAGGNPSYATAGAYGISSLIRQVRQSACFGLYENETARDCQWMIPAAHYLESWGDARAYDGTLSIVQPLLQPIAGGRTLTELLSLLLGAPDAHAYDLLREFWQRSGRFASAGGFDLAWRDLLRRGFLDGSAYPREPSSPPAVAATEASPSGAIDLIVRPHPRIRDGAFANNGWLQELPDPITTLTWGNAAQVSPATAGRLAIQTGDTLSIAAGGGRVRVPALVVPGHADDTITLHFGYGRDGAEAVARGAGVNVYPIWPGDRFAIGAAVSRVPDAPRHQFAITQPHHAIETDAPAKSITLDAVETPVSARPTTLRLYESPSSLPDGPAAKQWAMTIDLGACVGCGACVIACQAENNVPVVGRDQVERGREMHWLRIDWYAQAAAGAPPMIAQPMLCQQCENAPCEYVCPVEATVHSSDGLNEMVYNRCVGTRFCSNNCPYKVRRFNWLDFNAGLTDTERLVKNPDVTVRERGVMEKCTFCVQRIRQAEIAARLDRRPLQGADVRTACQQACPTQAIVFGSLDEHDSAVVRARESARAYAVLEDFGTEPRVRYLARVRNVNPDLERGT